MKNIKMELNSLSSKSLILLSTFLFLVLGFTYFSISKDIGTEPEIILMGNPAEIPPSLQSKLPTGYNWISKEQVPTDFPVVTGKLGSEVDAFMNDPRIIYRLADDLDLEEGIKYARENGKTQIYLLYVDVDPETMVPLSIEHAYDLFMKSIEDSIGNLSFLLEPFTIQEAFASSVPNHFCSGILTIPANTCIASGGGRTYCFKYSSRACHWQQWIVHSNSNMDSSGQPGSNVNNSSPVDFKTAMAYMGTPMGSISGLTIDIYLSNTDSGMVSSCGQVVAACAQCPNCGSIAKPSPRPHLGNLIVLADNTTRNNWAVVRHELSHNYSYSHCDIDLDVDNVARSINSFGSGSSMARPLTGCPSGWNECENRNICSQPPSSASFPNNIFN